MNIIAHGANREACKCILWCIQVSRFFQSCIDFVLLFYEFINFCTVRLFYNQGLVIFDGLFLLILSVPCGLYYITQEDCIVVYAVKKNLLIESIIILSSC